MSAKKFIGFGTLLALLLLISGSVSAKSFAANEMQEKGTFTLNQAEDSIHKNMLQPQTVSVGISSEHLAKPIPLGYAALLFNENSFSTVKPIGKTTTFLQDADRCESVSRLLFPFHIFW